ncbi:heterokaryon incompatibility protein-domain-containing protein [Nemania abortiva]|nr:heterokaryon incompatibility protein-domain-containing protein [Nemania abortiva]
MADQNDVAEWKVENDYSLYRPLHDASSTEETKRKQQIRLVTLAPGAPDDPIRCQLSRHSLESEDGRFEALSYCWGPLDDTVTMTLCHEDQPPSQSSSSSSGDDGHAERWSPHPREQTFNITKNLDQALRHLRDAAAPRTLWVDALCINQGSIRERNYAIAFMADVYARAADVVIYLGAERSGSASFGAFWDVMDMVDEAVARVGGEPLWKRPDIDAAIDELRVVRKTEAAGDDDGDDGGSSMFKLHVRLAFAAFFAYPWFQRVWVVQEAMNARRAVVQCGRRSRDWRDVIVMLHWAARSSRSYAGGWSGRHPQDMLPPFLWTKLHAARRGVVDAPAYLPLLDLIAGGRAFDATDPRDKVFALLSFGEETHDLANLPPRLKPDYSKTASTTWADLTRQWIIDHRSLDILGVPREKVDKNNQVARSTIFVGTKSDAGADVAHAVELPVAGHPSWALWHAEHPDAALRALFRRGAGDDKGTTMTTMTTMQASSFALDAGPLAHPADPAVLSLRGTALDRVTAVRWPFRRWTYGDDDMRIFDFSRSPPRTLRSGVSVVWAGAIGALSGLDDAASDDDENAQVKISFRSPVEIQPYPNHTALIQAFIETLTCRPFRKVWFLPGEPMVLDEGEEGGGGGGGSMDPAHRAELETIAHFAAHWAAGVDAEMKWLPEPWAERLRPLAAHGSSAEFTRLCEFAEDRCFFQTERGAFGLCPRGTRAGDVVASLGGGKTPFVLRPCDDGDGEGEGEGDSAREGRKGRCSLVGECYLHGLDIRRTTAAIAQDEDRVSVFHIV